MSKKIQGKKVKLVFHNASFHQRKELSTQIFQVLEGIDLTSGGMIILKLSNLDLKASYSLYKKPAKRIIHIYCE